nr:hypothetical protein [Tanacetum cinerariifolium]
MVVAQEVGEGVADEMHDEGVHVAGIIAEGDVSAANDEVPTANKEPSIPSPTPPTPPPQLSHDIPSTSQNFYEPSPRSNEYLYSSNKKVKHLEFDKIAQALEITKLKKRINTSDDTVMDDISNQGRMIADMDKDVDVVLEEAKDVGDDTKDDQDVEEEESELVELQEVVDIVTTAKIITEVVTAASTTITAADVLNPAATTAVALKLTVAPSKRTKGVVIRDPEESTSTTSTIIHSEAKSKDKGKRILDEVIDHVNKKAKEDKSVKRYQAMKKKPQTKDQARENMMMYLKNVAGFKMDYFKGMSYDDIRIVFEKHFDLNVAFLQKTKEQIDEEESRALKRKNETPAEKLAKR